MKNEEKRIIGNILHEEITIWNNFKLPYTTFNVITLPSQINFINFSQPISNYNF